MEKESSTNMICSHCSNIAEPDTAPPMCKDCMKLEKKAGEADRATLRDTVENKAEALWHTTE